VWPSSTITARWAVVYDSAAGTDAARPLIAVVDFDFNTSSTAGAFTITWPSSGIATVTVS
jgi:hypothetical protein